MEALQFHAPRDVRVGEADDARLLSATDALVAVEVAGLCGSDLHPYRGDEKGLDRGTILGHEFVGEIVELGTKVGSVQLGDRVVAPFSTSCGNCFFCRRRLTARCESGELFGWTEGGRGLHGAQAGLVRVPLADSTLVRVPDDLPSDTALFAGDILATGLFCADLGGVDDSTGVVVLGCGPVGLMAVLAARRRGAPTVVAIDSVPERLALAARFGAMSLELGNAQLVQPVMEMTGGRGPDAVLEMVGSAAATRLAVDLVRPGGVIAAAGVHTEAAFAFSPGEAYDKNLTYRAGRCSARTLMAEALEIVAAESQLLDSIITHRLPLREGPAAYRMFDEKRDGCVKVLLYPSVR